jgi:ribosome-binding protein aMBF1 (putative translation factor)
MNKNYYEKTILSDIVILFNQGHAFEIQYAGRLIENCKGAKSSAVYLTTKELQANLARLKDAQKEKEAQSILDGCTPTIDWNSTHEERATEIEPTYRDLVRRLYELIQKAREEQGLDNNRQPRPTSEMVSIYERLEEIRKPLALASYKWLVMINGMVHIVVVVLIGLGLRSRELIGRMFLAPFAWVLSGVKKAHEKV